MSVEDKLNQLIKLQKEEINILDQLLKLWRKYDAQYMEEVEKDNIANLSI